jgi:hypothetical protein
VLATLDPSVLALPDSILRLIPPRPPGYPASHENFARRTSPTFDSLAPAEAAAEIVVSLLLEPNRDQRLIEDHARSAQFPGFAELADNLMAATWKQKQATGYNGAIQRTVNAVVLNHLLALAANEKAPAQVRAVASLKLDDLKNWASSELNAETGEGRRAQLFFARQQIEQFEKNPAAFKVPQPAPPPAGDPIGEGGWQ